MSEVSLSPEQQAVYDRIETTRDNIFVTGRAGTGRRRPGQAHVGLCAGL